jgi:hypothetical protein
MTNNRDEHNVAQYEVCLFISYVSYHPIPLEECKEWIRRIDSSNVCMILYQDKRYIVFKIVVTLHPVNNMHVSYVKLKDSSIETVVR